VSETWEVIFNPDKSIEVKAESNEPGTLRVLFAPSPGEDITTETLAGGSIRVRFYGTLKIKSIPGGSADGSYEIPGGPNQPAS